MVFLFAYSDLKNNVLIFKNYIGGTFGKKNKQMGSNFSEGFHLQKFLFLFLCIRAR